MKPKIITILSGKGGVGKSSITGSLAVLLSKEKKIIAVDCDVDASNLGLVLGLEENDFESWEHTETSEKAKLIEDKCVSCRKCLEVCNFSAITWNDEKNLPIFNKFLCEGCGACTLVCPTKAIELVKVKNAKIGIGKTPYGFPIISGQLEMGESGSGKVVTEVKNKAMKIAEREKAEIMLVDSAAGIGCPVIASVNGSDFVIAVTEPTPSALNDLKRALSVVEHFRIPYGLIINKYDINPEFTKKIEEFAKENGIPILGLIPYSKKFVEAVINMKPVIVYEKRFESIFEEIKEKIVENPNI
ncbi:MAG: ATP-binding protein [Candidatus Aenigmarchaeota archaeon]|nr:ATP-binding protein [Candidatus Aenigmarchaeota archaeon]